MANTKKEQRKKIGRGNNPNSRANLKPSQPGMTNNPFGKPKGKKDRATVLKKWLDLIVTFKNEIPDDEEEQKKIFEALPESFQVTVEEAIGFALISEAKNGNIAAIKEINDSIYGKLTDKTEIEQNVKHSIDEETIKKINNIYDRFGSIK